MSTSVTGLRRLLVSEEENVAAINLPPGRTVIGRQHLIGLAEQHQALLENIHRSHAEFMCDEAGVTVTCIGVNKLRIELEDGGQPNLLREGEHQSVSPGTKIMLHVGMKGDNSESAMEHAKRQRTMSTFVLTEIEEERSTPEPPVLKEENSTAEMHGTPGGSGATASWTRAAAAKDSEGGWDMDEEIKEERALMIEAAEGPTPPEEASPPSSPEASQSRGAEDASPSLPALPAAFGPWLAAWQADARHNGVADGLMLDDEQRRIVWLACERRLNVFYTGPGGVGKSLVTRAILARLEQKLPCDTIAKCAPTGIAASHIFGTTVHSAFGVGVPEHYDDFKRMWAKKQKLRGTKMAEFKDKLQVLVLDEVSMLSGEFFDALDSMMREICEAREPFGGVQLVVCGDFYQLPPIPGAVPHVTWPLLDPEVLEGKHAAGDLGYQAQFYQHRLKKEHTEPRHLCEGCQLQQVFLNRGFAFQSAVWWQADFVFVELTRVYRQSEQTMVDTLNRVRTGRSTPGDVEWLNRHCLADAAVADAARPLLLTPFCKVAEERNQLERNQLERAGKQEWRWFAADWAFCFEDGQLQERSTVGEGADGLAEFFAGGDGGCPHEKRTALCDGARVILLTNLDLDAPGDQKLVNGSLGTMVGLASTAEAEAVVEATLAQVEKELTELRAEEESSDRSARSRSKLVDKISSLEDLLVRLPRWVMNSPQGEGGVRNLQHGGCWEGAWKLPRVRFDNGRTEILLPAVTRSEVLGQGVCCRMQIPLKMAWALTIHKSQGMSLSAASVQTRGSFAPGQAYVAISRVRSLRGLRFRKVCLDLSCDGCPSCRCPLEMRDVHVDPQVTRFYDACRLLESRRRALAVELASRGMGSDAETLRACGPIELAGEAQKLTTCVDARVDDVVRAMAQSVEQQARQLCPVQPDDVPDGVVTSWRRIRPEMKVQA